MTPDAIALLRRAAADRRPEVRRQALAAMPRTLR
jgi:hypothetical protein